ncbi:diaminopimelate epimerase [Lewinella aquimaris]|uniref:Diaminopimelate epimerase n=1 Tax=Neolewinella aquimaris TaxID=1835722 RepID=A0A840DXU0_9BACT|nr:diaminopimelate epimerase [Neolewinella aquimaris]MBB4077750.1 diaminopimelate epimerase [Neolewinella aquimaris]
MEINFRKYQGAGNDFILLDDRGGTLVDKLDRPTIARLCDRHFGIGADGLMLLRQADAEYDFEMVYFNADGGRSTMCGNGGRCIVRFAADLGIDREVYKFLAVDGPHEATVTPAGEVSLEMNDVTEIRELDGDLVLDTGSPHYLKFVDDLDDVDVVTNGRTIRQSPLFREAGINVNFVRETPEGLELATYERGVENETLACGTGVTAAVVGHLHRRGGTTDGPFRIKVRAKGGNLSVTGERYGTQYRHLRLIGPAELVFEGTFTI